MPWEDPHDIVRLASASNPFQAHIWQQALQQEGIRCQVLGDYLDAGIGNIPGMMAEIWVEAADATRAAAILDQHQGVSGQVPQADENPRVPQAARPFTNSDSSTNRFAKEKEQHRG